MPGCSSREARLCLSSRRPNSVTNVSRIFFSCNHCKCTVVCLIHPLNHLAERYLSNKSLFTTTAGYGQHGVSAESRSAARRPSVHFAPLDTYGDSLGCFVASRKSVGEGSLTQYRVGLRNAPKVGH